MHANANSTFLSNLRPAMQKPPVKARPSRAGFSDDKENFSVESVAAHTRQSRLKRPLSAASILESKSSELKNFKILDTGVEPTIPRKSMLLDVLPADHSLHEELRNSDFDFDDLIKAKNLGKATTLQDQKKRLDDQKAVIIRLRDGLKLQLKITDFIVGNMVAKEDAFRTSEEETKNTLHELQGKLDSTFSERDCLAAEVRKLVEERSCLSTDLDQNAEARLLAEKKIQELSKQSSELTVLKDTVYAELNRVKLMLDEKIREIDDLNASRDRSQINHDKELNDLRAQLGSEMVANHENKSKLSSLSESFAEAKTRLAVLDEQLRSGRAELERAEREREDLLSQVARLGHDKDAALQRAADAQARCDAKEAQQAETVRGLMAAQDLQLQRLRELATERDALSADLTRSRAETEEALGEARQARGEQQQASIDVRLADTEVRHLTASLQASARDLDAARAQAAEAAHARAEACERLAALEAEHKVYKEQAKFPHVEQIEMLCRLQRESAGLQHAKSASEADLARARADAEALRAEVADLTVRLVAAEAARRKLHNDLQELRGNIRIFGRLRPSSRRESLEEGDCPVEVSEASGQVSISYNGAASEFKFDRVFGQSATQAEVFEEVRHYVQSAMDGYRVSLLAYGQTGAGKTHTMVGAEGEHRGLVPRAVEQILAGVEEQARGGWAYTLEASCLEIYNETVRDLLADRGDDRCLQLRQSEAGGVEVGELTKVGVQTGQDIRRVLGAMERNKTVRGTDMNERSSRSHTVFQLDMTGVKGRQRLAGSLSLVDLAGSERLDKSGAVGDRLRETQAINKSLSALADVFTAISRKQAHVPFRNSKLTWLLQPCLSGDGKALVLMALSPAQASAHESLCTLRFSSLVSQCHLGKPTRHAALLPADRPTTSEDEGGPTPTAKRPLTVGANSADKRRRNV